MNDFVSTERFRWLLVATYAAAMAWVEAAVVFYLRLLAGGRMDPYHREAFPPQPGIERAEVIREAATLVMLLAVGGLAGRTARARLGYAVVAFGVWDIFYYVFLRMITGWPKSLWDWDILFLIPLPWWGPVIAPVAIAILMILWGTAVSQGRAPESMRGSGWKTWGMCGLGMLTALYVFMADALRALGEGSDVHRLLPVSFNWPLFLIALALMSAPVVVEFCRRERPTDCVPRTQ